MLTLVSLLFWVVTVALWARSGWIEEQWFRVSRSGRTFLVRSSKEGIVFNAATGWPAARWWPSYWYHLHDERGRFIPDMWDIGTPMQERWLGITYRRGMEREVALIQEPPDPGRLGPPMPFHEIALPHWYAATMTAALPVWWAVSVARRSVRRAVRRRAKRCVECGYDLRATPERCPECGAEVKGAA